MGNVFHKRHRVSRQPFPTPAVSEQKEADPRKGRSQYALLKEMFAYGLWGSADNIAEILTTRLNYFLIQRFAGLGSVGLLDAGTKISESVWHINRSIGFITYSRVARTHKPGEQKQITLRFFKLTFVPSHLRPAAFF